MKYALLILPLLLAACASPAQRAAYQAQVEAADHGDCIRLGYVPNTPTYGDCRLRIREMRIEERAINRAPTYYPDIGMHYGYHRHHW